jgi:hypothetical protein
VGAMNGAPAPWHRWTRIVEVGCGNAELADAACLAHSLAAGGMPRYLLVCAAEEAVRTAGTIPEVAAHVTALGRDTAPTANNAEVLILSGTKAGLLWRYRRLRHLDAIAFTPRFSPRGVYHLLGWMYHVAVRHYIGTVRLRCADGAGHERTLLMSRVPKPRRKAVPRRYIPHALGVEGFFRRLTEAGVRYAILRWFDTLPAVAAGEDVDFLVADEDVDTVHGLLDSGPGVIPVDCYSVSGLPGTQNSGMAYYGPHLARDIVANTVLIHGCFKVPDARHHFLSLAYHAVYHKGLASGIPPAKDGVPVPADHDYHDLLKRLAEACGVRTDVTLEALDRTLHGLGWRPPLDTLCKLAMDNPWIHSLIAPELARVTEYPGLACFIVHRTGHERGQTDAIVRRLENEGFEILAVRILDGGPAERAAAEVRGGNWVSNTTPAFWNPPAVAIAAYSLIPRKQTPQELKRYPHRHDARLAIKERIRDELNQDLPADQRATMLHSSDNALEAEEYLRSILLAEAQPILDRARALEKAFRTSEPIVRDLTRSGWRSKVELIRFGDGLAIKKTFRPSQRRALEREAQALRALAGMPFVPELLAESGTALITRYYEDHLRFDNRGGRLLSRVIARGMIIALRQLYERGYAHLDADPVNFIYNRTHGLKLIDYEYAHRYEHRPATFAESWDIVGRPDTYAGPAPGGHQATYVSRFLPHIGLTLDSLLHSPAWVQIGRRLLFRLRYIERIVRQRMKAARR